MPNGSLQGLPIPLTQAVEKKETASFGGEKAWGEASSNGQPAQTHREDKLNHHRHPEWRQGVCPEPVNPAAEVELPFRSCNSAETDAQPKNGSGDQCNHAQLQTGWQRSVDDGAYWLLIDQSLTKISVN